MTRYSYKHFEMSFFLEKNGKKLIFGKKITLLRSSENPSGLQQS